MVIGFEIIPIPSTFLSDPSPMSHPEVVSSILTGRSALPIVDVFGVWYPIGFDHVRLQRYPSRWVPMDTSTTRRTRKASTLHFFFYVLLLSEACPSSFFFFACRVRTVRNVSLSLSLSLGCWIASWKNPSRSWKP